MTVDALRFSVPYLFALTLSYLSTPLVIKFANKIGIVDDPKKSIHPKTIHTYPVPRGGGLATFIGIAISSIIFLPLDIHLVSILIGASLIIILGIYDDLKNLNPYYRLISQFIIAAIPIIAGIGIDFINNPFGGGIINLSQPALSLNISGYFVNLSLIADLFALLWIVFMMNILNMGAKGVDGQLPGVVTISAFIIALLSLKFSADITQWPVIIMALIVSGAYLGFLPFNVYPQKIMPGFSGGTLAGYMLAIIAVLSTTKVGTLLVVLGIPIVDTGYTILRRIYHKKSPVWGDAGHLHHRLLRSGLSKHQVSLFYWILTAILGVISLNLNASNKFYTIIGITLFVGGLLLWLTYQTRKPIT